MKNSHIIFAVVIVIGIATLAWHKRSPQIAVPPTEEQTSILGCYIARIGKDIYTMHLESTNGENISGTLDFDNFQKDSSTGSFSGTHKNGILLGDYSFRSEGMDSVTQIIFKKVGDDFIRGSGEFTREGNRFANLSTVTYDSSSALYTFKKESCSEITSQIIFPAGGENLIKGQTYSLRWTGGPEPIQIFLIDTSLKSAGASVSISDRIYSLENKGIYEYTIPMSLKSGIYEFQIGNSTSKTFKVL